MLVGAAHEKIGWRRGTVIMAEKISADCSKLAKGFVATNIPWAAYCKEPGVSRCSTTSAVL
jgi:hypothetical protein